MAICLWTVDDPWQPREGIFCCPEDWNVAPPNLGARLQAVGLPSTTVTIANISNHGARVITHRPCQPHEQLILTELFGDFHVDAEVIYCQRADGDQYAVGLRFATAIERPEAPAARA